MLELDPDPDVAFAEMSGVIFYLTAFGYIDGEIDAREVAFIRDTIHKVVAHRLGERAGAARLEAEEARFQALVETIQAEVVQILNDSVIETESRHFFIRCRLKQRCFEIFKVFTPDQQRELLATIDELVLADEVAHPAELKLRGELAELLRSEGSPPPRRVSPAPAAITRAVKVREQAVCPVRGEPSAGFALFEHSWVPDARVRRRQISADRELVRKALGVLARQRKRWRAVKLAGRTSVDQLAGAPSFLDGFVQGLMPQPGQEYEVTVLGDLHGCYSCLKAALTQSRFLEKVAAWRREPAKHPEPHLVMLGDYIDRGRYGFNGVLRLALRLLTAAPDNVVMLRGNHELLFDQDGTVRSLITPADSLEAIRPLVPISLLRDYRKLFDALPTSLLLGRMLLTHGGIPQDGVVKALWRDLSSLNEPAIRFQMLWSDPSLSDVIPRALQDPMVRFGFGRLQCQAFLERLGCHTLLRGHGLVSLGFLRHFDDQGVLAMTLCSAGGLGNRDLPPVSDYRLVRPMALTLRHTGGLDGATEIDAWPIEYEPFNTPELNGFYAELQGVAGP